MSTIEGLEKVQGSIDQTGQQLDQQARMAAAKQASDLFKSGDVKGAIGALAAVDPAHAINFMSVLSKIDPGTIGAIAGAKSQGALPGQLSLQGLKNSGALAVAQVKANAPKAQDQVVRADPNSPTGFSRINKKTGAYNQVNQSNLPQPQPNQSNLMADASGQPMPPEQQPKPNLRPNQAVDSNGQIITITPGQRKIMEQSRKAFDSETKEIVKGLEAGHTAQTLIDSNNAGGEPLERLRLLKTVTQRPTQQEFQAIGQGMGAIDSLENSLQKLGNGKMTPQIQKNYLAIVNLLTQKLSEEYDSHLKNAVERNPEVDPLVLKQHLVGKSGPTAYQNIAKQVSNMPPEDQAAFNWAHSNPSDPRAKAILQKLGMH